MPTSRPANRAKKREALNAAAKGKPGSPQQGSLRLVSKEESVARKESAIAMMREIDVDLAMGKLVRADMIEPAWAELASKLKERLLALGARLALRCSRSENPREIKQLIDDAVREALAEIGEKPPGTA